jgi:hypothetical protein
MSRSAFSFPAAVAFFFFAWGPAACGGAVSSNLLGGSRGVDSGGGTENDSGVPTEQDSGTEPLDAGTTPDVVTVIDSSEPLDVTPIEEPPPPTGPTVACPMNGTPATCQPGDICCIAGDPMLGTQTHTCEQPAGVCTGTKVTCTVPTDCPMGQMCCGTEQTTGTTAMYTGVSCATQCNGANMRIFCSSNTDCPAQTATCGASTLLPGYMVCQ